MVREHSLNYRVIGKGRPVVFLHGFLESISMWDYLGEFKGVHSIFIDLPGHGKSALTSELTMQTIAKSIVQLLNELKVESFDIVGHSMGGYVALEVKKIQKSCDKIILLNSNFWEDTASKKEERHRVAALVEQRKENFINSSIPNLFVEPDLFQSELDALIEEAKNISWESIAAASIAMSERSNNSPLVKENQRDVCIIQGAHDTVISADLMARKLEGSEIIYHVLPSGHMAHIECSNLVRETIAKYLGP